MNYKHIKYVNMGLLQGLRRSGGQLSLVNDEGEWGTLGGLARQLIDDSPEDLKESVLCQFIHNNSEALKQFSLPWFLPEHLCGVGLPTVGKYAPAKFDLQVARKIYENPDKFHVSTIKPDVPYKVWEYATGRFRATNAQKFNGYGEDESMLSESDILGALCIESLFRVKSIDDLMKPQEGDDTGTKSFSKDAMSDAFKAMRKLSKTWLRAREDKSIELRGPLDPIPPPIPSGSNIKFALLTTKSVLLTE